MEEREKVIAAGGLYIIGTERHESRRIDNQLRGRAGRQGDPGASKFFISLEDDLMRLFGSDKVLKLVNALGLEEDQPIEHRMLSNAIETAQKRVEGRNFSIRKNVLQFDDVMNKQREVIYAQRRNVLDGENLNEHFKKIITNTVERIISMFCSDENDSSTWDIEGLVAYFAPFVNNETLEIIKTEYENYTSTDLKEMLTNVALEKYAAQENTIGPVIRELERVILLRTVDEKWMDHIDIIDHLRQGIYMRAFGQKDPVVEFKFEAYKMFEEMITTIQEDASKIILNVKLSAEEDAPKRQRVAEPIEASHGEEVIKKPASRDDSKTGRNDPCPCGSGKKYKKCHGN
jgi:preprotein translocase subunit SecA